MHCQDVKFNDFLIRHLSEVEFLLLKLLQLACEGFRVPDNLHITYLPTGFPSFTQPMHASVCTKGNNPLINEETIRAHDLLSLCGGWLRITCFIALARSMLLHIENYRPPLQYSCRT